MDVSIELLYTDDVTGEHLSEGHVIEDVQVLGEPVMLIGERPVTDLEQTEPVPGSLMRWTGRCLGCSNVEVRVWELK